MNSHRSRFKAGFACVLACILPFAWTQSACAAAVGDGRWPVMNDVVQNAWKQGIDGSGVKVAVMDSTVVEDNPALSDADITYKLGRFEDMNGDSAQCLIDGKPLSATMKAGTDGRYSTHGTDMLSWIVGNGDNYRSDRPGVVGAAPKAKILSIANSIAAPGVTVNTPCDGKMLNDVSSDSGADVDTAVQWGARIINRSQDGSLIDRDYTSYVNALKRGVIIVEGRDNDTNPGPDDLTGDPRQMQYFPGVVMVNSITQDGDLADTSDTVDGNVAVLSYGQNVLKPVTDISKGDLRIGNGGTSTAAAVLTSYLTLAAQKWPEATGNQLIQSLIRNTKSGKGKPVIDPERKRGFGEVDLNALLTVDPTQYKDINPILEYQMKAAAQYPDMKDWYTQDCKTNPNGIGSAADNPIPCEAGLIGNEYERQQAAWKKVEQCRADGGSDCMKYSATATAGGDAGGGGKNGVAKKSDAVQAVEAGTFPAWAWLAAGVGAAVVVMAVVMAVVLGRRKSHAVRRAGAVPPYGVARGNGLQAPPANSPQWSQPVQAQGYRSADSYQAMPQMSPQPEDGRQRPIYPYPTPYPQSPQTYQPQSDANPGSRHGRHSR